jgi:hypothetical protein
MKLAQIISSLIGGSAVLIATTAPSHAAYMTFFGHDTGLGEGTPLSSYVNSQNARNNFFSHLIASETENFEGFATGTNLPLNINFGSDTATISGTGSVGSVTPGTTNGVGRYAISGNKYVDTTSNMVLGFSAPQAAFGFYGVDIGDFNGQVTLTLTGGRTETINVGNPVNSPGGGVLYFGLIATSAADTFTSIQFGNTASGTDYFAFDDFTIASLQETQSVPEPTTILGTLAFSALGGGSWLKRKRQKQG